jgi:cytochrome c-type biogenesis protein CcmF
MLLGAAFTVMWGTMFPLISEGVTGQQISVGPPFFQRVNFPIGLVLLALTGIGPVVAWRRATKKNLQRNFATPVVVGAVVAAIIWISGARHALALTTWGISAFVLTIIVTEFWKGTRARARIEGEGYALALFNLVSRNRRRWGGYIVHVGIVLIFMAFAGAAYNVDERFHVEPGDVVEISSPMGHTYQLTYEGLSMSRGNGQRNLLWQAIATVSVSREGEPQGVLTTEKRKYTTQAVQDPPMTEVGIKSYPLEDLYLILSALDDQGAALSADSGAQGLDLQVLIKPLVSWIWIGCLTLVAGTLIALWPSVDRRRSEGSDAPAAEPATVGAAS